MMDKLEKLTFGVNESAALLGMSIHGVYDAIRRNDIPHIRIGKKYLIPKKALEQLLDSASKPQQVKGN